MREFFKVRVFIKAKEPIINGVLNRMKREVKSLLTGLLMLPLSLIFLVWGLIDILSVTGGPLELLIVMPIIVFGIILLILGILFVVIFIGVRRNVLHKKVYNCVKCGVVIKLEVEFCANCGANNVFKDEALEKLEKLETKIAKFKAKRSERLQSSKRSLTSRDKRALESEERMLFNEERDLRVKKTKLIIGGSQEGKLDWIKAQHYDLKRTIQEIADDLGESMIAIGKYLDEIENQDK